LVGYGLGIFGLVVFGNIGGGDEDNRFAYDRQFADRASTCTRDNHIGKGEGRFHVLHKGEDTHPIALQVLVLREVVSPTLPEDLYFFLLEKW
jgi:hypothetical protein